MKKLTLVMAMIALIIGTTVVASESIVCSTKTQTFTYVFKKNKVLEYHLKAKGYEDRAEGRWVMKGNLIELYMFQEGTEFRESTIRIKNSGIYWFNANEKKYTRKCNFIEN